MYINIKQYQKMGILLVILMFINAFGEENRQYFSRITECTVLCEKLNLNTKSIINTTEEKSRKCALLLGQNIRTNKVNNTWEKMNAVYKTKNLKINFIDSLQTNNLVKLNKKNTTIVSSLTTCRNLINLIKTINRILRKLQSLCGLQMKACHEKKQIKTSGQPSIYCIEEKWQVGFNATFWPNVIKRMAEFNKTKTFHIINEEPEYIDISIREGLKTSEIILWYASYANATVPRFECRKIQRRNVTIHVIPNVNYLICLAAIGKHFQLNIFDCQPFKTKPLRENQPLLIKKSIPTLITSLFVLFVLAMVMGASALYLTIHKNPSLIRGGKRVIEVKRQDKTHVLIMPRGYEGLPQHESPLALSIANNALEPEMSTLSCDTNSTISYVSANQPTPVEILTYRLNRLRELFQSSNNNSNNDLPQLVSSIPMSFSMSLNQRLPPNVDLLLEYEWYTITTTAEDR